MMKARVGAGLALCVAAAAGPVQATEFCGWLTETVDAEAVHIFTLWLQADTEADIFYALKGEGIVSDCCKTYGPAKGSFVLHARRAAKVWTYGSSVNAPADIDIIAEVHAPPKSIFDEEESPLLAAFTFRRHVPEDEAKPPAKFAEHQCVVVAPAK